MRRERTAFGPQIEAKRFTGELDSALKLADLASI
jgi:hypothetical protein